MTLFEIAGLYIALNLILAPILMFRVGQVRIKEKVGLGDGNNPVVIARMRAHANFAENAPFALIGLLALAHLNAAPLALHIFGAVFTFGRLAHAHGMAQTKALGKGRSIGILATLLCFIGMAIYIVIQIFKA